MHFYKQNRLLKRVLLFTAAAAGLHALWDTQHGSVLVVALDLGIAAWMLLLFFLNHRGFTEFTRYGYLISASLILLAYGAVVPHENGVNLLFLPLISLTFVTFEYTQHLPKLLMSLFILGCYVLLEISDYQLFGNMLLLEEPDRGSFIANFCLTAVLLYLILTSITQANYIAGHHLQQITSEVQQQNDQLRKTNEELDRFVYSTSHDLRAPLLSVLGLLQLLERKKSDEAQQPYLDMMRKRINNLETFVNDITAFARNARLPLQPEPVDLSQLAGEVLQNHEFLHPESSLELRKEIYVHQAVRIDRRRLYTILNNLVSNAVQYHRLQHPQSFVALGASLEEGQLHLWVSDNGPGIAPAIQARMFEMFYRGDERSGGSGLGLYIVKETAEKMGGKLGVDTHPGTGSTFHIWIPVPSKEHTLIHDHIQVNA